jgi:hypothetical protein
MHDENCVIHAEPQKANNYIAAHVALLLSSLRRWTGRTLVDSALPAEEQARRIFEAPFVLLSHDAAPDPILNYANRTGLQLFELAWNELVAMPSRLTAEAPERAERARLLAEVSARGFIDNYSGVRVARSGRRFRIERATVWNVVDETGRYIGQAAMFSDWRNLS